MSWASPGISEYISESSVLYPTVSKAVNLYLYSQDLQRSNSLLQTELGSGFTGRFHLRGSPFHTSKTKCLTFILLLLTRNGNVVFFFFKESYMFVRHVVIPSFKKKKKSSFFRNYVKCFGVNVKGLKSLHF